MDEAPPEISEDLLGRARGGDEEAADALVRLLYPLVHASVRRHIRVVADHDDVAQEIFMKLFLKLGQYRGPQPFEHWVSRLAVTTCYDWLRKRRARPLTVFADLGEAEARAIAATPGPGLGGDLEARRELFTGLLDRLLAGLKPREQIVIRLLDLEQQTLREVSEATGWSLSKVKTTAMRARRKLAEALRRLEHRGGAGAAPE